MDTRAVLELGKARLCKLPGHSFDVLEVYKPKSVDAAIELTKVISKLSPLVGNLIEFNTVEFLNGQEEFKGVGSWRRQDPGFPDAVFDGVTPTPGFEIKAWFPLATEITARFKDSQNHFVEDQTHVAMLAWLPEFLIYGKPQIVQVCVVSGRSVAEARDKHYHRPPDYLVTEPEVTTDRTSNLQQTNTNGFKWQEKSAEKRAEAEELVKSWGYTEYDPSPSYQSLVRELRGKYNYRGDTNYAKMDRIQHEEIESFKSAVHNTVMHGMTIGDWNKLLSRGSEEDVRAALRANLEIKEDEAV